jgi:hypothetical protein
VIITEGEFDCMLAEQETGYIGVSPTNGAKTFQEDWVKLFHGHHVVAVYDCDKEGREAVAGLVLPVFQKAVESGQVFSIKAIWLYPGSDKAHKDVTDWITKDGGSGEELKKNIADTPAISIPPPPSTWKIPSSLKVSPRLIGLNMPGRGSRSTSRCMGRTPWPTTGPKRSG